MRSRGRLFIAVLAIGVVGAMSGPAASTGRARTPQDSQQAAYTEQAKIVSEAIKKAHNRILSISIPELRGRASASLSRSSEKFQLSYEATKAGDWPLATTLLVSAMDFANATLKIGAAAKKVDPYVVELRASLATKRQRVNAALLCWKARQAQLNVAENSLKVAVNTMGADESPSVSQTFGASETLEAVTLNCK